jgi:DHA1 family tetracycline resistance protein-like MFS transporter
VQPARQGRQRRPAGLLEPWFAPFALVNGAAVGVTPILLPVVAARHGLGHVGIVMGAFNLGAFAAPLVGSLADRRRAYRALATACAAVTAVSLWLFPLAGNALQVLLALGDGAGFAGAVTIANLLVVERHPRAEWNQRLGWLETALSVGQGGALFLSAWLSGLSPKDGLLIGALVPAAAIPLALLLIPRMPAGRAAPPEPASPGPGHQLASIGHVGEWGPASPSRVHRAWMWPRRRLTGVTGLLRGGLGWMLAAWLPAYAGSAIIFSLYPVLFRQAFGIGTATSALAFAVIVFVSLPLFVLAGRASQRFGPAPVIAAAYIGRIILLTALAAFAAAGHVPEVLPLAAFAGIMFAWSFLSVASPGLAGQLRPDAEGDAQGLLNACSGLAGLLGSVTGGVAADLWGYPAALAIGAGATAAGLAIFAVTLLRRRPAPAGVPG